MSTQTTIYALSTAPGTAGIAVIRLSGANSLPILQQLCPAIDAQPRMAVRAHLKHPATSLTLDDALTLYFQAPASFTGEDVVELHLHGGRAIIQAVMDAIAATKLAQMAEPGEFTRRAFDNGKMDLTGAEAVADLIHAETEFQRRQAILHYQGGLRDLVLQWRKTLINSLAYCDAALDFADEDLPDGLDDSVKPQIRDLVASMQTIMNDQNKGERLRDGIQLAILGAPNAGKSSLLNRLGRRDIAITSPQAGTTRDVIEVHLDIGGYPFILADTAGLREQQQDRIEAEGIKRALNRAKMADIRVLLFDGTQPPEQQSLDLINPRTIIVLNKADLSDGLTIPDALKPHNPIHLSAKTGQGLDLLLNRITELASTLAGTAETPTLNRQRHHDILSACIRDLQQGLLETEPELIAECWRHASVQLGRMTGHVDVEDLLDVIFSDFCIGK